MKHVFPIILMVAYMGATVVEFYAGRTLVMGYWGSAGLITMFAYLMSL